MDVVHVYQNRFLVLSPLHGEVESLNLLVAHSQLQYKTIRKQMMWLKCKS